MNSAHGRIAGRRRVLARVPATHRQKLRLAAAIVASLLVLALSLPLPNLGGASVAVAAVQRVKSFVELMHERSPGKRLVGHLVKTKHKKLALHERALPKIRKHAPELAASPPFLTELPPALVDLVAPPIPAEMASLGSIPVGPFGVPNGFPPGFFLPPSGGFVVPPGETPGTPPVVTPPVIPEAVPEPATWTFMLLGFVLMGWSLRRRRHREQTAA